MKLLRTLTTLGCFLTLATGCASTGGGSSETSVAAAMPHISATPAWISEPTLDGGLVTTTCVDDNASMSILKNKATMMARADLAKELEQKTSAMVCVMQSQGQTSETAEYYEGMQSKMQGVTRQYLRGSRVERADYAMVGGKQQFCAMVSIQKAQADKLRDALFDGSGMDVDDAQEAKMWEEFLYVEASEDLGGCPE
jgi:hypothetical protein